MKKIKISNYYFNEIGAGAAWVIFDAKCPYCKKEKHTETLDYCNSETKQKCECGENFLVIFEQ